MSGRTLGYLALLVLLMPLLATTCLEDERYREIAEKPHNSVLAAARFQEAQQLHELDVNFEEIGFSLLACASVALLLYTWPREIKSPKTRIQDHRCPKCGYDCCATMTGCPECGTQFTSAPLAKTPTPPRPKRS